MCCSRGHYPAEVGLLDVEANNKVGADGPALNTSYGCHYHIVLPNKMQVVCITVISGWNLMVVWRSFAHKDPHLEAAACNLMPDGELFDTDWNEYYERKRELTSRVGELIAIGIAEGGEVHTEWLDNLLREADICPFKVERRPWSSGGVTSGLYEWKILPDEPLEYHEWLVAQARAEVKDRESFEILKI